ncbi:MAG TPA: hypothetical protein VJN89_10255 [Candidatus Acidoferrum sp.]|nr:hypothetical protein [Candidatus Acidoferrum sp.]
MKRQPSDLHHAPNQSLSFGPIKAAAPLIFAALVFAALAWASDPPWKAKPYDQWTDKDLEKIFTDSPWARIGTVTRTWAPLSSKEGTSGTYNKPQPASPMSGARSGGPGGAAPPSGGDAGATGDELRFNVYWASSRIMRAASARKSVLHGGKQDVDVAKYASEPQEEYQIVVQSEDMTPFVRHDEKFYQDNSSLDVKKTKQKISPSHVSYEKDEKGQVGAAVFFFPKKTASGEPNVPSDEKNVEFNCKIEGSRLRVNFDPQKMVDSQGPSL